MNFLKIELDKVNSLICISLFITTLLFICIQLFVPPYIGLANNGDFERLSLTCGLGYEIIPWEDARWQDRFFTYMSPLFYERDTMEINGSHFTTAKIMVTIAKALNAQFNLNWEFYRQFDMRWLGAVLFAVYAFSIGSIYKLISLLRITYAIPIGILSCLFFSDILVTQYFNTFYGEATGYVFLIMLLVFMLLALPQLNLLKRKRSLFFLVAFQSLLALLLMLSKLQYFVYIFPLSILLGIQFIANTERIEGRKNIFVRKIVSVVVICCIPMFLISVGVYFSKSSVSRLGSENSIMGDLLRFSKNPEEHLEKMGFSLEEIEIIKPSIGHSVFTADEEAVSMVRERNKFTRTDQFRLLFYEPKLLWDITLEKSKTLFMLPGWGVFQKEYGYEPYARDGRFAFMSKFNEFLFVRSFAFFLSVLLISVCFSFFSLIKTKSWFDYTPYHILICLSIMCGFQFFITILGDSVDHIRHFFSTNVLFIIIFYTTLFLILYQCPYMLSKRSSPKGYFGKKTHKKGL